MTGPLSYTILLVDPLFSFEEETVASPRPRTEAGPSTQESIEAFQRAAAASPRDPDYQFLLGAALTRAARPAEALPALREAVRLAPGVAAYRVALGRALWHLDQAEEAADAWREGRDLGAHDAATLIGLGAALVRADRSADGRPLLERGLAGEGVDGSRGIALWYLGRRKEALDAFRAALRARPVSATRRRNVGLALLALGRREEASETFREAARLRPTEAAPLLDLAEAAGDGDQEIYARAVAMDPTLSAHPAVRRARQEALYERVREDVASEEGFGRKMIDAVAVGLVATGEAAQEGARGTRRAIRKVVLLWWSVALVLALHAGWVFLPPRLTYYLLRDDLMGAARTPIDDDSHVMERIMAAVEERGLGGHVQESDCEIESRQRWRVITCRYTIPRTVVPGVVFRHSFTARVEQPYLALPRPVFY